MRDFKNLEVVYYDESEFMPKLKIRVGKSVSQLDVKRIAENTFLVFENNTTIRSSSWIRYCMLFKMNDTKTVSLIAVHSSDAELYRKHIKDITKDGTLEKIRYSDFSFNLKWLDSTYT